MWVLVFWTAPGTAAPASAFLYSDASQSQNQESSPTVKPKLVALAVALAVPTTLAVTTGSADAARSYSNCKALNRDYAHGVGRPSARDRTRGKRVTNFKRSSKLYNANRSKDRDGDGIACEKA